MAAEGAGVGRGAGVGVGSAAGAAGEDAGGCDAAGAGGVFCAFAVVPVVTSNVMTDNTTARDFIEVPWLNFCEDWLVPAWEAIFYYIASGNFAYRKLTIDDV